MLSPQVVADTTVWTSPPIDEYDKPSEISQVEVGMSIFFKRFEDVFAYPSSLDPCESYPSHSGAADVSTKRKSTAKECVWPIEVAVGRFRWSSTPTLVY